MQIDPAEIGFDIDGVVADTSEAFLRIARQDYGICDINHCDITNFNVAECLPIPADIVDDIFDFLMREPLNADMRPMPDAVQVLTRIASTKPITFITARPHKQPVADWLEHFLPPEVFKQTRLTAMGDHEGKIKYIKQHKLRYFVDDRTETCLDVQKAGITPIVFTQPWNEGRHNLLTVDSWRSIEEKLQF
jgi:uncharacterized HAD superfamily protein